MTRPLVIFDLGNVLVHVDFQKTLDSWSALSGLDHETILKRFDMNGDIHLGFERGEVSRDRLVNTLSDALGVRITTRQFENSWNAMIGDVYPGITELIDQLKARGTKLAILSNTNRVHEIFFMKKFARLLSRFEGIFVSHKLKFRKPESAVFEAVLKKFHANPSDSYFLDDKKENIDGAVRTGIHACHVRTVEEIGQALKDWKLID